MKNIPKFIGLDTRYLTADGKLLTRTHFDGAASPLGAKTALDTINKLLPHYSNTHSYVHSSAQISTNALAWAHDMVLKFVGANSKQYASVFIGSGTTAAINRIARGLHYKRPERNVIFISSMEHHANDLPHRQFGNEIIYLPLMGHGPNMGGLDLDKLKLLCEKYSNKVNYLAVASVSNVTGVVNPIKKICQIAHQYGIYVLVDGAQSVAHGPTELPDLNADFFVFSGHKVYTPMSPGVLIAKRFLLDGLIGQDLGGGSVSKVSFYDYQLVNNYSEKEESGTPNIVGAVALGSVLRELMKFGLDNIKARDSGLIDRLLNELNSLDYITVYANLQLKRVGAIAFNHSFIDHGLLAAILNDYFAIAVRNECFCAHPYVGNMLKNELWQLNLDEIEENKQECYLKKKQGMVRASISLYNDESDIDHLIDSIKTISTNLEKYTNHYIAQQDGSYKHNSYFLEWEKELDIDLSF